MALPTITDEPRPGQAARYIRRIFDPVRMMEENARARDRGDDVAMAGWPLRAPDDEVKAAVIKQRNGQQLNEREMALVGRRVAAENETARMGGVVREGVVPQRLSAVELGRRDRETAVENQREVEEYSAGFEGRPVRRLGGGTPTWVKERIARNTRAGLESDPETGNAIRSTVNAGAATATPAPRGYALRQLDDGTFRGASQSSNGETELKDFKSRDEAVAYYRPPQANKSAPATVPAGQGTDLFETFRTPAPAYTPRRIFEAPAKTSETSGRIETPTQQPHTEPASIVSRRIGEQPQGQAAPVTVPRPKPTVAAKPSSPKAPAKPGFFAKRTEAEFVRDYPNVAAVNHLFESNGGMLPALKGAGSGLKHVTEAPTKLGEIMSDISAARAVTAKHEFRERRQELRQKGDARLAGIAEDRARAARIQQRLRENERTRTADVVRRAPLYGQNAGAPR